MPATAAAYATLDSAADVPRATPMLNIVQRIGGSLGVTVLGVVLANALQSQLAHAPGGRLVGGEGVVGGTLSAAARERFADPLGAAFAHAYLWSLALILIALVPALLLVREERRSARQGRREQAAMAVARR